MDSVGTTESSVRRYFRAKTSQLHSLAQTAVCEHPSLIGSCREDFCRLYLREVLPRRYAVGRGMIYGPMHRSHEVDIVVWDELNYVSLPTSDHSFFFAESVRTAIECKSTWSLENMQDVFKKCRSVRDIWIPHGSGLDDSIALMKEQLEATLSGRAYEGTLTVPHRIATAAIFLNGGEEFKSNFLNASLTIEVDDEWPDLLLLLGPGKIVIKNYSRGDAFAGSGWLDFYEIDSDALLLFTSGLLAMLEERSVLTEPASRLSMYTPQLAKADPVAQVPFRLTRPPSQRTAFWK